MCEWHPPTGLNQTHPMQWLTPVLALGMLLLAGACSRTPVPALEASEPRSPTGFLNDGRPQAGLQRIKLYVGPEILNTELALTTEAIQKGMMWRTNVPENEAMLFVFARAHQTAFWMKNVPMDIDVAYVDPEGAILEIHRLERQNTNPVGAKTDRVQFALETAEGWFKRHGISTGVVIRTEHGSLGETFFPRRR